MEEIIEIERARDWADKQGFTETAKALSSLIEHVALCTQPYPAEVYFGEKTVPPRFLNS